MSSRETVLARIRSALSDVQPAQADVPIPWTFGQPTNVGDVNELFVERVEDYQAIVIQCTPPEIPRLIGDALARAGARSVVVPGGIPEEWLAQLGDIRIVRDEPPLTHAQLDATDAVLTGSAVGIAETGTIVLDHRADQGRRALTLVPDLHICVVRTDQVVTDVPEGVARLQQSIVEGLPQTWISGPSATSDIELTRVEGVHGPRTLHVLFVRPS